MQIPPKMLTSHKSRDAIAMHHGPHNKYLNKKPPLDVFFPQQTSLEPLLDQQLGSATYQSGRITFSWSLRFMHNLQHCLGGPTSFSFI